DPQASPVEQLDYVHDDYLQVAAELGVVGIALALWLGIAIVRSARRALAAGGPNERVVLAFLLLTAGVLTDAVFSFPLERALPPLLLAIALAVLDGRTVPPAVALPSRRTVAVVAAIVVLGL